PFPLFPNIGPRNLNPPQMQPLNMTLNGAPTNGAHWTPLPGGGIALHLNIPGDAAFGPGPNANGAVPPQPNGGGGGPNVNLGGNAGGPRIGPFNLNLQLGDIMAHLGAALGAAGVGNPFAPSEPEIEDPERAKTLVDALQVVPEGLVRRL